MTEEVSSPSVQEYTPDRKDLKIQHYKEKVAMLEDALADTRVELTFVSDELRKTQEKLAKYKDADVSEEAEVPSDDAN